MNKFKMKYLPLLFGAAQFLSCVPREFRAKKQNDEIEQAIAEAVRTKGLADTVMPHPAVMALGTLIPIVGIVGFFIALYLLYKMYHKKEVLLIEKGLYNPAADKRLELLLLFFGLVLMFVGPAISVWMVSYYGPYSWAVTGGLIPLMVGLGFVAFYYIVAQMKKKK